jgi:ferric-dicitrate binding protein FerR (iron transport regulator)
VDYNTLFNPRGSKVISLTLSDGTKVWLNAESSLRYPISFASGVYPDGGRTPSALNREVEITGEAYFEVKHNSKQPFKVHLPNGSIVEDIGTSFNINAYPDEDATKTTLIEGSIKISAPSADKNLRHQREKILKPGEQLVQSPDHQITRSPDVDEVMAWKSGWFEFENTSLPIILRQIRRWYDVEIVYTKSAVAETFGGRISKDLPLSNVLHSLEQNSKLKFRIEGKRLIVE